ncbi:FAD-binding protein [Agromyces silvae]|uniref:FAD-binding protein n=1 Tax=Agromyces silvae TaxID=3388266 RepID=UPI00280B268F|nr:FAD-binding protein [Agromyces protaetiae]
MPPLHHEPSGVSWAATHRYAAARVVFPETVDDVRAIVRSEPRVRALGTRHSFNDLADSPGSLVSLQRMRGEPVLDPDASEVWVPAGLPYGALAGWLDARGFALPNLGSLPHISVAGACAAGTHGSGDANGCLSTSVTGLELVDGRGEIVTLRRGDPEFAGAVIGLGALGIATRLRLAAIPRYLMRQDVYLDLPWATFLERSAEVMAGGYSVSVFGRWGADTLAQVWRKRVVDGETDASDSDAFFGAVPAGERVMSPADEDHDNTTVQGGVVGPWAERLPHFRFDTVPSNGDEIQSEYFVERAHVRDALTAVRALADEIDPVLLVTEFRTIAADALWMSPHVGRDNFAIHFTWRNRPDEVRAVLPKIEAALEPFDPRPHWGKWFAMDADTIVPKYRQYDAFRALRERLDPEHRFGNAYLERVLRLPG